MLLCPIAKVRIEIVILSFSDLHGKVTTLAPAALPCHVVEQRKDSQPTVENPKQSNRAVSGFGTRLANPLRKQLCSGAAEIVLKE